MDGGTFGRVIVTGAVSDLRKATRSAISPLERCKGLRSAESPAASDPCPLARTMFLKLIGMSTVKFDRYWIEKQYASAETPPMKAPDETAVINFVGMLKGAIGFVSRETLAADKLTSKQVSKQGIRAISRCRSARSLTN